MIRLCLVLIGSWVTVSGWSEQHPYFEASFAVYKAKLCAVQKPEINAATAETASRLAKFRSEAVRSGFEPELDEMDARLRALAAEMLVAVCSPSPEATIGYARARVSKFGEWVRAK